MTAFVRNHLIRDAIGQALYDAMREDDSICIFGEGAQVKVHYDAPQIETDFPDRVQTMPISEDGNTNFAVGAALMGVKPVVDVIGADFLYRTLDSIGNTAAKINFVRGPDGGPCTIVIRSEFLLGGPTTGQRPEAIFTHIPGLRVIVPSAPRDAYSLMRMPLATPGVTLFFEDRMIQDDDEWDPWDLETGHPEGDNSCGKSKWCYQGKRGNVTILSYGVMRQVVQRILRKYQFDGDYHGEDYGMLCDLIDLRSLYPIDWSFITKILERTGRLLIVEPDIKYGGIGAEIAAHFAETMPRVRIKRLGAPMTTIPASESLHSQMLPSEEEIVSAIRTLNQD